MGKNRTKCPNFHHSERLKYVLKTVLDIVKIEIEENGFWSKIENTRTIKIFKIDESECLKYVLKTVLDIVIIEIEENRFWS